MSVLKAKQLNYSRAIELVESEVQDSCRNDHTMTFNSPIKNIEEVPKVNIRHIMSASSSLNDNQSIIRLRSLHSNQKIILVSMVILSDKLGERQNIESV